MGKSGIGGRCNVSAKMGINGTVSYVKRIPYVPATYSGIKSTNNAYARVGTIGVATSAFPSRSARKGSTSTSSPSSACARLGTSGMATTASTAPLAKYGIILVLVANVPQVHSPPTRAAPTSRSAPLAKCGYPRLALANVPSCQFGMAITVYSTPAPMAGCGMSSTDHANVPTAMLLLMGFVSLPELLALMGRCGTLLFMLANALPGPTRVL